MALVKMSELLRRAKKLGTGCGSFSVYSMEAVMGAVKAAKERNTSIIIQLAEARFNTAPLELVGSMMINAANAASVDIAVHLDHGSSFDVIERALQMGFTSVMYDGSARTFEENIENTCKVKAMADRYGADVEAELGLVGRSEGGDYDYGIHWTKAEDAETFVNQTGVAALAVAIGNQHGNYQSEPKLRFDILKDIHERLPDLPLVLHGGSGISDGDFRRCIENGISKINIATAILNEIVKESKTYFDTEPVPDYYGLNQKMAEGAYRAVEHHIRIFNM